MKPIRAIFKSSESTDRIPQRNIVVSLDRHIYIGRAPNHATKKPKAAEDNFYLMSPIVSRRHATITVSVSGCLEITDNNSTHGTSVNGINLKPNTNKTLQVGDKLRFGIPIINGNSTHKPPEFKVLFMDSATSQLPSNPWEVANNKWQFVVPESDSSCGGDDNVDGESKNCETFSSPPIYVDDISLCEENDILGKLVDDADSLHCSLELTDEEPHENNVQQCSDDVELSNAKDDTINMLNKLQNKEEDDKAVDCNRSKTLTSLKNILNDSSTIHSQEIVDTPVCGKVPHSCEEEAHLCPVVVSNAQASSQHKKDIRRSTDKQSPSFDEILGREAEPFGMSDIIKVCTSPPKEEGCGHSETAILKRKADCISTDTNNYSNEELRKENKKLATALAKCTSGNIPEQNTCISSAKASKTTGLKFTSALFGAVFGGVGVFATLASLPENFFK